MAGRVRESGGDDLEESHEINVTPFIDVMLVLLIIFMVAAPMSTVDVPVDLPGSNAAPQERPPEPVYLSVQSDLSVTLGEVTVTPETLAATLDARTGGDREQRIFLRADQAVAYGDLMGVMNQLRDAGYLKVALVGLENVPAGTQPAAPAGGVTP